MEAPESAGLSIGTWIGERILANERNWLIPAPATNPGLIRMFAHRLDPHACNLPGDNGDPVPWAGEFAGKYLLSGVQSLRLTGDAALEGVLRQFVADLIATQGADGSLGLPLDWDLWGQYHVLSGLLRWYEHTGDAAALQACERAADLACARYLGRASAIATDHPADAEKNQAFAHALALLYEHTGQQRYLELLHAIEADWGARADGGNFLNNALAGLDFYQGARPRWESLHDVQAIAELYFVTGEDRYRHGFEQIWRSIRTHDRHATGGFSSGEAATGNPYDPRYIETCGTVAWMALTIDMLRMTGDAAVADELELSLFNAVLGAQSPDGRLWTYHTPMGGIPVNDVSPANRFGYRFPACHDLEWQAKDWYPQLSCCAANGPRGLGCLADWAVMSSGDAVVVNYYGEMTAHLHAPGGTPLVLTQSTAYPVDGSISLRVDPASPSEFALRLRIPAWSKNTSISVNGSPVACAPGTYCRVHRGWSPGDVVRLQIDLSVRVERGERNAAGLGVAYRGPVLLALDTGRDRHRPATPPTLRLTPPPRPLSRQAGPQQVVFASSDGPVTLCDFASAGVSAGAALFGKPGATGWWQFSRSDGSLIAERIRLAPDGSLQGYAHPNEARWGYDGDVLTFYDRGGHPSTRFTLRRSLHGKAELSGRSLLDPRFRHLLSEVDVGVSGKTWQFRRAMPDGTVLIQTLKLLPGGRFDVPTHPNETSWRMDGDDVVFCNAQGVPSTRFHAIRMHRGRVLRSGQFLFDGRITHELAEIEPDVTATIWSLIRQQDGQFDQVIDDKIRLLPGGAIDGHAHPNEARWEPGAEPGTLVFRAATGQVSTAFRAERAEDGLMRYRGAFAFDPKYHHVLAESARGWVFDSTYVSWLPFEV
jgi:DUF1680 family protein